MKKHPPMDSKDGRRLSPLVISHKRKSDCKDDVTEEPLSPAARMFHEPSFDCCIVVTMGFEQEIDVDRVKARLEDTLIHHPRFSSVLVQRDGTGGENPRWVRTKVVVDDHVVVPDLSSGGGAASEQLVEDYVSSLSAAALDPSRPLWDIHLLNVPAAAAAVFRAHHSLGDCTSFVSLLLACTRKTSDPDSLPAAPPPSRRQRVAETKMWGAASLAWNTVVDFLLLLATLAFLRDTKTPLTATACGGPRAMRMVRRTVSLDDIKAVKNAMDCTINDVLVGVTSAGLSRYLGRNYGEKKSGIHIRAAMVVNTRPIPGIQDLAKMMEGDRGGARWGNSFGFIILPLPLGMQDDPLDYIQKSKAITERKKNSFEAIFTEGLTYLGMKMFGRKVTAFLTLKLFQRTTLTFSNNVGPVEGIEFCGNPIVYLATGVFGGPHAIALYFQSYMNKMEIVAAVNEEVVPDPHELLGDLADSLNFIKDAASKKCC